jgi:hypothetical protein
MGLDEAVDCRGIIRQAQLGEKILKDMYWFFHVALPVVANAAPGGIEAD